MAPPHTGQTAKSRQVSSWASCASGLSAPTEVTGTAVAGTLGEALGAGAVSQEAVVTNAMEAVRQRVEKEAADELEALRGP